MTAYSPLHELFYARALDKLVECLYPKNGNKNGSKLGGQSSLDSLSTSPISVLVEGLDNSFGISHQNLSSSSNRACLSNQFTDWSAYKSKDAVALSRSDLNRQDMMGRTVLHLIAASNDPAVVPFAQHLIVHKGINVNIQDSESGWTALHRALYHGNIVVARLLISHPSVDLSIKDREGYTAFDIYNSTIKGTNPFDNGNGAKELFTWGTNKNYILGVPGDGDKLIPDKVMISDTKIKPKKFAPPEAHIPYTSVKVLDVKMSKMHSALVTNESTSNIRLCGFANGGRLGQTERTQFSFEHLPSKPKNVTSVSLGQDHTAYVTSAGELFTFGLGIRGQLGYANDNENSNSPSKEFIQHTPKRVVGSLKKEFITCVGASRLHTACCTHDGSVYTWGTNRGQLGYASNATSIQWTPRRVPSIEMASQITATEVATAILTSEGKVLMLHADQCYKISFSSATGGGAGGPTQFLNNRFASSTPMKTSIKKISGCGPHFIAIAEVGDLYYWSLESSQIGGASSTPRKINVKPERVWEVRRSFTAVADACVGDDYILLCTKSGHVYLRTRRLEVKANELRRGNDPFDSSNLSGSPHSITLAAANATNTTLSTNNKKFYTVKRIPYLQRIVKVFTNSDNSFAAIRADVSPSLLQPQTPEIIPFVDRLFRMLPHIQRYGVSEFPFVSPASYHLIETEDLEETENMVYKHEIDLSYHLCCMVAQWESSFQKHDLGTDIAIVVNGQHYIYVHKAILASRSSVLRKLLSGSSYQLDSIRFKSAKSNSSKVSYSKSTSTSPSFTIDTLHFSHCSLLTILLLVHYLYVDEVISIWDPRVSRELLNKLASTSYKMKIAINVICDELQRIAHFLELPELAYALGGASKRTPKPTLSRDLEKLWKAQTWPPDITVQLSNNDVFHAHSVILRPQSPFFDVLYSSDWNEIQAPNENLKVNLQHMDKHIFDIVIRHVYMDLGVEIFEEFENILTQDQYIDLVFEVLAIANELLLDRLKEVCSETLSRMINLNNVCSILVEADFLEAKSLQHVCEEYISCNLETMLESHLLDCLKEIQLSQLSAYIKSEQWKHSKFARSGAGIDELMIKHREWLSGEDIPGPSFGWRIGRERQQLQSHSQLRQQQVVDQTPKSDDDIPFSSSFTSPSLTPNQRSLQHSPLVKAYGLGSSPNTYNYTSICSPTIDPTAKSSRQSPAALRPLPEDEPFQMDDLVEPSSSHKSTGFSSPWGKLPSEEAIPSLNLRQIMKSQSNEEPKKSIARSYDTSSQVNFDKNNNIPTIPLTTKKDRRKVSLDTFTSEASTSPKNKPRPAWSSSTSWRTPPKASMASIQAEQAEIDKKTELSSSLSRVSNSYPIPNSPESTKSLTTPTSMKPNKSAITQNSNNSNHNSQAPFIWTNLPSKTSGNRNTPVWNNYQSPLADSLKPSHGESLLSIVVRQSEEDAALKARPEPRSLEDIRRQEENDSKEERARMLEEKRFMQWWEEESAKTMAMLAATENTSTKPEASSRTATNRRRNNTGKKNGNDKDNQMQKSKVKHRSNKKQSEDAKNHTISSTPRAVT